MMPKIDSAKGEESEEVTGKDTLLMILSRRA